MRKLLLATTMAVLGASTVAISIAEAQTNPPPGTVTVRLNGRFRFFASIVDDRDVDNNLQGGNGTTPLSGFNKQANYTFGTYSRLFPGFDGVAANGLKYGAAMEIRSDSIAGAGQGIYGSTSQQDRARGSLYFRRTWGYLGTDKLGTIRLGTTDSPSSLYLTGNFENFNDGGLDGDVWQTISVAGEILWPFANVGSLYSTTKAVYLSPQVFGFDFGVSYEPNSGGASFQSNCGSGSPTGVNFTTPAGAGVVATGANAASISGPGCDRLASTPTNDNTRRRNTVDALLRYRGTFGGFGIAATGSYIGSSHVLDSATPRRAVQFGGLSLGDFGIALTYGGLSVGGNYQVGRYNGQWALAPQGARSAQAILVGASYTVGPVVVGFHALRYQSPGDTTQALAHRERLENGLAAGGTYSLAPGVALFLGYLYEERRQNGFNFVTNNTSSPTEHNKITSQLFTLGTGFSW